jgi:hypothetical protein
MNSTNTAAVDLAAGAGDGVSAIDTTSHRGFDQVNTHPLRTVPTSGTGGEPADTTDSPADTGLTSTNIEPKRVARLRAAVAEARGVLALQDDPALTAADTDRVLAERRKAAEAYKLHQLGADPARKALRDNRVRRLVAIVGGGGLVGALGWSMANVQRTVVAGQHLGTSDVAWWLAFLVEPVVSVGLLLIFGVRAYIAATRAISINDHHLRRTEISLLAITLTVNSWLYLPRVSLHPHLAVHFDPLQLLVHSIGPIVAVLLVTVIPVLWQYITDTGTGDDTTADPDIARWLALARQLLADGVLAPGTSRTALEKTLREHGGRISTATAMRVYRCLTGSVRL